MSKLLTPDERSRAYAEIKERFGLNHVQRTRLDHSPIYEWVMEAAHAQNWSYVEQLLGEIERGEDR